MKTIIKAIIAVMIVLLFVGQASAGQYSVNGSTSPQWQNTSYNDTRIKYAYGNIILNWVPPNASGHWTFDNESFRDENLSASTNLTNTGAVYNTTHCKFGECYWFDTATDYMTFEDNAKWDWTPVTQNRSLSLWFYPTVQPTNDGNPFQFLMTATTTGNHYSFVYLQSGGTLMLFTLIQNSTWATLGYVYSVNTLVLNTWNHIVFIPVGATNSQIWVNGVSQSLTYSSWDDSVAISPSVMTIKSNTGASTGTGLVDDMRWFERGISSDEVNQLRNNTYQSNGNSMHWHNSGSGNETDHIDVNASGQTDANYSTFYRINGTGAWTAIGTANYTANQSISLSPKYQNTDVKVELYGNNTATPELMQITFWTQTVSAGNFIPPTPINLANTTGNFWINYTWEAGSGNITNIYNRSVTRANALWWENNTDNYSFIWVQRGTWTNISVYAYNSSGSGVLNQTSLIGSYWLDGNTIGNDYYVSIQGNNASSGNLSYPWQNVSNATQRVVAGDAIYLLNGTWNNETASFANSGNATHPITLTAYNGTPTLNGVINNRTGTWNAITIDSKSYINITNISITNYNIGIYMYLSSYINLNNLTIYNNTGTQLHSASLWFSGANNSIIENSSIHDNGGTKIGGTSTFQNDIGITGTGTIDAHNITIRNNIISDTPGTSATVPLAGMTSHNLIDISGVTPGTSRDIYIYNNTLFNSTTGNNCGSGVYLHGDTGYHPKRVNINNNTIYHALGVVIDMGENNTIQDNNINDSYIGFGGQYGRGNNTYINNTLTNIGYSGVYLKISTDISPNIYQNNTIGSYYHLDGFGTIIDPKLTYTVRTLTSNTLTVRYSDNSVFFTTGTNKTYYYPTKSEYITLGAETNIPFTKYNRTLQPSQNNVTSSNTSTIWRINYSSNPVPRLNLSTDITTSINLSGLTGTIYNLTYTGNDTIKTSISASSNMANFSGVGIGSYYITEIQSSTYSISGYVNDSLGSTISSLLVINGTNSTSTNATGYYQIMSMSNGTYNFTYSKTGYVTNYKEITVNGADVTNQNITLLGTFEINQCKTLSDEGSYTIITNLSSDGTCITIGANNISVDGADYTIKYGTTLAGFGVNNTGYNNITIINMTITQNSSNPHRDGINFSNVNNSNLNNLTITTVGPDASPIRLNNSRNNTISNNTISSSGTHTSGYETLESSNYNTISNNIFTCSGTDRECVALWESSNNLIQNNTMNATGGRSIGVAVLQNSHNNTLSNNNIYASVANAIGIYLANSNNNTVSGGSIISLYSNDYFLSNIFRNNTFNNTNFTTRKINFDTVVTEFNYSNNSQLSWISTNVSSVKTITRTINNWTQPNITITDNIDSGTATAYYNVSGFTPSTLYNIYNGSTLQESQTSSSSGTLNSFSINLTTSPITIKITTDQVSTSTITVPANSWGMFNNWSTYNTTFINIAANESNDISYTYYNTTSGDWESYFIGYTYNQNNPIGQHNSVLGFFNAQTTITANTVTPSNTNLLTGWNMLYVEGTSNRTLSAIKTNIELSCTMSDIYNYDTSTQDYSNTLTNSLVPNEGFIVYIDSNCTWTRTTI